MVVTALGVAACAHDDQNGTLEPSNSSTEAGSRPPDEQLARLGSLEITPGSATVAQGASRQFTAGVRYNGTLYTVAPYWRATGGAIDSRGNFVAGKTAGRFTVSASFWGLTGSSPVTVGGGTSAAATLTSLSLTPATVTVAPSATQQFSVSGQWSDGSKTAPAVAYSATGGTITSAGLYTAPKTTGTYRVIAAQAGGTRKDTSVVTVQAKSATLTLSVLTLTPVSLTLAPGATQQFSVAGQWSDGSKTVPVVTYSATGGTITSAGLYTAPTAAGSYKVTASYLSGLVTATSTVTVQASASTGNLGNAPLGKLLNANFDDGGLDGLSPWGSPSPHVVSDATARGGKAVQFDWRSGAEQNIGLLAKVNAGKKVHVRVRYKQGAGADNSGIKKTIRVRATIDGVSDRAIGTLDIQWGRWNFFGDDFGDGNNHFQNSGSEATAGPDTFRGTWRYVELMVDYSTVGYQKARIWVDGTLVLDASIKLSQNMSSNMNIDWVYLASVFNGPSNTRSEWFDDVAVSTDYIGVP
jgi:hypothetical protein